MILIAGIAINLFSFIAHLAIGALVIWLILYWIGCVELAFL